MAQNVPPAGGIPPRQTGQITFGGQNRYVTEEFINNPLTRQIFEKYGLNLYNPKLPGKQGEQWAVMPKEVNYWQDSRRIGRYYNAIRSMPEGMQPPQWLDVDRINAAYTQLSGEFGPDWQNWGLLDKSHPVYSFMGEQSPPPLEQLPSWERQDFQVVSDALKQNALKTTEGPVGEWTNYGIDYATWQKLPEWKKWANIGFRSMGGQLGQQAINLGIAGASVAGVPGFFGGAVAGAGMGYLGVKEQEHQAEMLAAGLQYKPGVAYYMMGTLNFLFTQAQQALALRQQMQNALVDPQTYGSVSEILKDIPAAYEAGEAFYSLLPYDIGSAFSKDGKVRVVNIAGEDTFIEAAPKGKLGSGIELREIRRMLASGQLSPEQVREYTIQKYGFLAEMTDLLAGYVLDPLDMIGPVSSGIIGNRADISGNVPLAKAFLGEGAPGELLKGYKLYRRNLRELPVNDVIKMGNVTRWFAGFDPEGIDVRLKQPGASGNFAQRFVDKAFGMTAESRAIDLQHDFVNGMKTMLGAEEGNVDGMYRMVGKFAELTPEKTVEAVENAKVKVSVGGVDTEVDMPRWALSGEAQSIPLMLKDQMPKVNDHYDQWKTTRPQAELLQRFADAVGEDVHKLKADLHGDNPKTDYDTLMRRITALANEGDAKAKAFLDNVGKMKDLNNAALKKAAGLFLGENGAAFDPGMWAAQLIYILEEGADAWAVKWFGIKPSGWVYRLGGVIKQAQGILLLGFNPWYLANNAVNNVVTMAWDGLLGSMSKKMRAEYLRRFGTPTKLRQGIGGAETGVKESDIGQKVRAATRAKDGIQEASDILHSTDKFQVAAILSQRVERWSSEVSTVKGLMEFMGREWRPGRGFDKITGDLRLVLDAARPGLADEVERLVANGLNKTEIEKNIFTKVGVPSLKDVMTPDEYNMMNSFPGLVDDIDKGIRDATSDEEIRKVFSDAINKAQQAIDDDISRKAMAIMHSYAIGVQVDGLQFVHDKLDTLVPDRHDNWNLHFDHMGEVAEQGKKLSGIELHNLWATERQAASEQWRTFTNAEGAKWQGIFYGLGAERMSAESGLVAQNLSDVHDIWNNFFQHTQDRMQELVDYKDTTDFTGMSKNEADALVSAKWAEVSEKLNGEYIDSSLVEDLYQVELDDLLKKRARQELSYQKAQEIGEWRDEQLKVRRTMIQATTAFRTGNVPETVLAQFGSLLPADTLAKIRLLNDGNALYKLSRKERDAANDKFYKDIYRPLIGSMMERATPETKGAKPKAKEAVPAPKEAAPTARKLEETAIWKLIAEKHPELAGVDEQGRINFDAKLAIIKWLRKWSAEARARNVKKWADVTPALILEAWQAEQVAPKVETPPVIEEPAIAEAVEPVAVGEQPAVVAAKQPWEMTRIEWANKDQLPPQQPIPETGSYWYIKTDDGGIYVGDDTVKSHVLLAEKLGIPAHRISGGGYIENGVMTEGITTTANIENYSSTAKARVRTEHKRAVTKALQEGKPVPDEVLADYPDLIQRVADNAELTASLTEEAALTDGMTPEAAIEFEAVQRAEAARENVIAKANDMRENANDLLMLAPPKEVNGEIFREYLHEVFADRYADKPQRGSERADAVWTVIDRIAETLSREQGITKDKWYQNLVLERGGTELSGNALYVSDPAKFIANVDRIDYQKGDDWYEYSIILKDGTSDTATVGADELRTVLGDTVAQKIIDGDSFGSLQGNDLQGLSTSGFLVRRATGATYWLENGRAVIHAFSRADVADMLHEYVHAITPMLPDGDKATVKAWYEAEYKRVLPDDWSDKSASDVDAMEKLARAFERYMTEGPTGFTGEIVRVFANIKKWMLDIYKSLTHNDINVRMNDDMRGMFDRWLGAEPKPATAAIEPPAPKPDMWQKRQGPLARAESRAVTRGEWSAFEDSPGHLVIEHNGEQKATADIDATGVPSEPTYAELTLLERNEVTALLREFKQTYQQRTSYPPGMLYRTPTDAEGKPFEPPPAANAPLGTADELTGMPVEDITLQGWTQHARPAIERAQRAILAQKREKLNLQENLTKEGDALLRAYLGKVYTQLADTKMAATKWGESRRSAALLDYNKRTGFDQLAGMIFPYQFWYTRTAMNWFLRALNKPSIIANYFRLMRMSQRAERDDGYPQRLKGKMAIPMPWLPDWMGGTAYADPWKQAFPLLQITRPLEKYAQEKNQIERRTDQILYEMVDDGTATDEDVQNAIDTRTGNLYIKAKAQAESEDQRDFENPFDFAAALSSPSLPLSFAYNWMMGRKDRIGQLPFTRLVQNTTAMAGIGGPRGVNLEGWWRKGLGLPEVDQWEDYRVRRELANMVAEGLTDTDTANKAMIDHTGDVFVEAQRRVSQTGAVRYMGSILALDIFPEGEMIQRGLQDEFAAAYDAKAAGDKDAVNKFFDKYPEYSSRLLAMKNEPEEQMRSFLKGIVWEKYLALPKAQAKEFRAAAGELFEEAFLNSETRSYDSISTDTFAMWANALNKGAVSEKAGGAALPVDWLNDETAKAIDAYYNEKTRMFGEYDPNAAPDPNYTTWQNQYLAAHPDIIQYVIGETNSLYGLPEDIQRYVYAYRAERDQRYPDIFDTQEKYFALSQSQRKGFIKAHPELASYWDFRRQKAADFPKAAAYIMSEESLSAEILDEDRVSYSGGGSTGGYTSGYSNATYSDGRPAENYHPPYLTSSEIRRFSQPLIMQLLARFYRNEKLMPGAYTELTSIWEQLGKPFGNLEDFIENAVKPTIMQ